jgi:hypothetical protein
MLHLEFLYVRMFVLYARMLLVSPTYPKERKNVFKEFSIPVNEDSPLTIKVVAEVAVHIEEARQHGCLRAHCTSSSIEQPSANIYLYDIPRSRHPGFPPVVLLCLFYFVLSSSTLHKIHYLFFSFPFCFFTSVTQGLVHPTLIYRSYL